MLLCTFLQLRRLKEELAAPLAELIAEEEKRDVIFSTGNEDGDDHKIPVTIKKENIDVKIEHEHACDGDDHKIPVAIKLENIDVKIEHENAFDEDDHKIPVAIKLENVDVDAYYDGDAEAHANSNANSDTNAEGNHLDIGNDASGNDNSDTHHNFEANVDTDDGKGEIEESNINAQSSSNHGIKWRQDIPTPTPTPTIQIENSAESSSPRPRKRKSDQLITTSQSRENSATTHEARNRIQCNDHFQGIKAHTKAEHGHGHSNIEQHGEEKKHLDLGEWCKNVKIPMRKKERNVTPEIISLDTSDDEIKDQDLTEIVWAQSPKQNINKFYSDRLEELKNFKNRYGHCNISFHVEEETFKPLAYWCSRVRMSMEQKLRNERPEINLIDDLIGDLTELGFVWDFNPYTKTIPYKNTI